jgi:signal transduction histidine kinase
MREAPEDSRLHEPVDVAALVTAIVHEAQQQNGAIAFCLITAPNGAYVIGDERALRRLAHNLLVNAGRHTRSRISVSVAVGARNVILTVEDDGDGVAPADRERIDRFFKAQRHSPGAGLGLAICRHIATRHGGTIALEDRARFVARLPQAPP